MSSEYVLQVPEPKFSDLSLTFCGYEDCRPGHSFGPAVRPNYIIHFILDGRGMYQIGGSTYPLQKGQGFLIEPDVLTFYQADSREPWSYLWVGFDGKNAAQYLEDLGLGAGRVVFSSEYGEELKAIVLKMLEQNCTKPESDYVLQSLLYGFFGVLARDSGIPRARYREVENQYTRRAVEFIRNNYPDGIRISDVAGHVGITRSYLYTIFMKTFGVPPREYLSNYRISRAAELLSLTDLTIEAIAASCGYEDPLVFSKAFKKQRGLSPTGYRRANRERTERGSAVQRGSAVP